MREPAVRETDIASFQTKHRMRAEAHGQQQIAGLTVVLRDTAQAPEPEPLAIEHTGRIHEPPRSVRPGAHRFHHTCPRIAPPRRNHDLRKRRRFSRWRELPRTLPLPLHSPHILDRASSIQLAPSHSSQAAALTSRYGFAAPRRPRRWSTIIVAAIRPPRAGRGRLIIAPPFDPAVPSSMSVSYAERASLNCSSAAGSGLRSDASALPGAETHRRISASPSSGARPRISLRSGTAFARITSVGVGRNGAACPRLSRSTKCGIHLDLSYREH